MVTRNGNIFRQARQLLDRKDNGAQLTDEERELVNIAIIPLMQLRQYNDIPIGEGLEEFAKIFEEAEQNGAVPKRDQVRTVSHVR